VTKVSLHVLPIIQPSKALKEIRSTDPNQAKIIYWSHSFFIHRQIPSMLASSLTHYLLQSSNLNESS